MSYNQWQAVIGLEIHAQFKTESKAFSNDSASFSKKENQNISPLSLGLPGTLPTLNKKVVEFAIKTGLALNSQIKLRSVFSRKNYFYPDLPKGYQISQFDQPICEGGFVEFYLNEDLKKVKITRAHIEEDAGQSVHQKTQTLINFNRSGVALLEIVSEPDMSTAKEAAEYARTVRNILRYIDVCDGSLEEGSLRCDCNISVKKTDAIKLGTRTELKNINSFKFIEKAIDFEIQRQISCLEEGKSIAQETRLYDSNKNETVLMRLKEDAADYRYFPEPDLAPLIIDSDWIEKIKQEMPELATQKCSRFQDKYKLSKYDSQILTQEKHLANYFEAVVKVCGNAKASSNWVMGEVLQELKESKTHILDFSVTQKKLADLITLVEDGVVSRTMAKKVFQEMCQDLSKNKTPKEIIETRGLAQISDVKVIQKLIDAILLKNQKQTQEYRDGKTKLFSFFIGEAMKETRGKVNPKLLSQILKKTLKV